MAKRTYTKRTRKAKAVKPSKALSTLIKKEVRKNSVPELKRYQESSMVDFKFFHNGLNRIPLLVPDMLVKGSSNAQRIGDKIRIKRFRVEYRLETPLSPNNIYTDMHLRFVVAKTNNPSLDIGSIFPGSYISTINAPTATVQQNGLSVVKDFKMFLPNADVGRERIGVFYVKPMQHVFTDARHSHLYLYVTGSTAHGTLNTHLATIKYRITIDYEDA